MGKACTFFGHRDCPASIEQELCDVLTDLIENHAVDTFFVGQQGAFDKMAASVLKELAAIYPNIQFSIVLDRLPAGQIDNPNTMFPDGIEFVHPRYAISWRNRWMIKNSDYVVAYVTHSWGGAAKFTRFAQRQNKTVINLAKNYRPQP